MLNTVDSTLCLTAGPALPHDREPAAASHAWKYAVPQQSAASIGNVGSSSQSTGAARCLGQSRFGKPCLDVVYRFMISAGQAATDGLMYQIADVHSSPAPFVQKNSAKSLIQSLDTRYNIRLEGVVSRRQSNHAQTTPSGLRNRNTLRPIIDLPFRHLSEICPVPPRSH